MPTIDEHVEGLANGFRTLGNPTRLRLLEFLRTPHYLREIASFLGISHQAARKHVNALADEGMVRRSVREGTSIVVYVADVSRLVDLHCDLEMLGAMLRGDTCPAESPQTGNGAAGPCLTVVRGHPARGRYPLSHTTATIGRGSDCTVEIEDDPYVGSRHAKLLSDGCTWKVIDLGSDGGTWHNWRPIPSGERARLKHGDILGVGQTLLLFWDAGV